MRLNIPFNTSLVLLLLSSFPTFSQQIVVPEHLKPRIISLNGELKGRAVEIVSEAQTATLRIACTPQTDIIVSVFAHDAQSADRVVPAIFVMDDHNTLTFQATVYRYDSGHIEYRVHPEHMRMSSKRPTRLLKHLVSRAKVQIQVGKAGQTEVFDIGSTAPLVPYLAAQCQYNVLN